MSRPGFWPSPITADQAVASGRSLEAVAFAGDQLWWSEGRPDDGGRVVVCTRGGAGEVVDLLPGPWNARTRVHEYGGTSWLPVPGPSGFDLVFANLDDQRLYRLAAGGQPVPLTPEPARAAGLRYADLQWDERRSRILAVRETHRGDGTFGTVDRTIVGIPVNGAGATDDSAVVDLLAGAPRADFLAGPRLSGHGDALTWISWNHPDMPWDRTTAHLAPVARGGGLGAIRVIAGGPGVSVVDPGFLPDGSVVVMSDATGWWQPTLIDPRTGSSRTLSTVEQEFAPPLWVLGRRSWAAVPGGRLLVRPDGRPSLLDTFTDELTALDPAWTWTGDLAADRTGRMAVIVGSDVAASEIVSITPGGLRSVVRSASDIPLAAGLAPVPVERTFDGVHAIVYPPTNPGFSADPGPAPVIITVHGGPTAQHNRTLSATTAYFTSRGFAVAAVDHHGSTGYGRPYRDALRGHWAELDIADAITVAAGLLADGSAGIAFISGGSAGGLTVLGALTTEGNPFGGGTSSYGIGDLRALLVSTHDFESRYLEGLLGSDPDVLDARSPLRHTDRLATPVLLLQGGRDPIVTPDQAESFAAACAAKGIEHDLIIFPEEGHGFRSAAARKTALEAELRFYQGILGA
ncbi:Dipeptidyl aminopeptidase/acylaminoacyl peptidase [Nakamurella panacisegetis]|uniref:Dipeptidyl aminopeptidase/acylaminoacyl peptidase n=1 Tax=Nakamurella panacisegetis TaxID=1090615 RepID=A0A1H0SKK4_9ACTN|nr:prolyl oligopeptidase family serine peptidase [Nakamurella panacisegetis]SDP42362.1 Dipeptidyl aminopeptidase/acylaminoacyl peptidase [Nakamurella panacisegetis]